MSDPYFFVCDCEEWMRPACWREIFFKTHEGRRYCVLHYPGVEKVKEFEKALKRKVDAQDFNFSGVWFPKEVDFSGQELAKVSFRSANFNSFASFRGTKFGSYADFQRAHFANASFRKARFKFADFGKARFEEADFLYAWFDDAYFVEAEFVGNVRFNPSRFRKSANFSGTRFGGRAFFGKARFKGASFGNAIFGELVDFGDVFFRRVNFVKAQFNAKANFGDAQFRDKANFQLVHFKKVSFNGAKFKANADFESATFASDAEFRATLFSGNVLFDHTEFQEKCDFTGTCFGLVLPNKRPSVPHGATSTYIAKMVSFHNVIFKGAVVFEKSIFGSQIMLQFAGAAFEQPQRASFHEVTLRPIWLVRVLDLGKLQFTKVSWTSYEHLREKTRERELRGSKFISSELRALEEDKVGTPHQSLEIVCRQLAFNAEENNRYEEASRFRFLVSEARRRETWFNLKAAPGRWGSWRNLNPLLWVYGAVSGYGEKVWQAAFVLGGIWFLFAIIFFIGQRNGQWWRPLTSSGQASTSSTEAQAQAQPSPQVQLTSKVQSTAQASPTAQVQLMPRAQSTAQTSPIAQVLPTAKISPIPQVSPTPQVSPSPQISPTPPLKLGFGETLAYSANVITLQRPEPLPANVWAKTFILLETVFGPLQLALLALAIRRKFMR